ncbi:hypothetical protein GCM10010964_19880 [Caldovatus sediminis]|uniref:Uncharacterized protein n=1 Tax=Caldovatus sediminis TaxID=2041189 RepID=A0A8J3EC30_9PROT|nr:hypothetical protein [Caldovatus sediminis]GGG31973.1 hypothetical protein GCM10010964_19880 [Caldovatus sediminis]
MRSETIEVLLLCGIVLCGALSFGWISAEDLRHMLSLLFLWAALSTALVGAAGAWVAIVRSLRARNAANAQAAGNSVR